MSAALSQPLPAFEFSIASRGVSKGLAQTDGPQFVGRGELAAGSLFVGGYWKNVTSTTSKGEAGAIIGIRKKVRGWNLAASATLRIATSPTAGSDDKALELAGAISRKIGRLTPQLSVVWSPDDLGSARRSTYVEASAAYALSVNTSLSAAVGHRDRQNGLSYTAFNVGVTHSVGRHLTADLRYYRTDRRHLGYTYQPGLIASVRARF